MRANTSLIEVKKIDPSSKVKEFDDKAELSLLGARGVAISNNDDYLSVGLSMKDDKADLKLLEVERKKISVPINEALDALNLLFRKPREKLEQSIEIKNEAMLTWDKKVREEKARLEREARERQEKEAKKKEEAAKKAAASGNTEKAEDLLRQAEETRAITPQVNNDAPKIAGLTLRENHWAEIADLKVLIRHCLATGNPYVIGDQKTLDALARSTKGKAVVPGVVFHSETKMAGARE